MTNTAQYKLCTVQHTCIATHALLWGKSLVRAENFSTIESNVLKAKNSGITSYDTGARAIVNTHRSEQLATANNLFLRLTIEFGAVS